jgi:biotin-dependent carboxylase-like uncharacterized protein
MSLVVIDPGLSTTVQDAGRPGYRSWGVPCGGAFDASAAGLANALVGNPAGMAVLEFTLVGGCYEAQVPLALALAGAPMEARLCPAAGAERRLSLPLSFPMLPGDRLRLGGALIGARTYLAVLGGWSTTVVLGSRSTEDRVRAGAVLPCQSGTTRVRHLEGPAPDVASNRPIRVVEGPDFPALEPGWIDPGRVFKVRPESNRMGLRLEGPPWPIAPDPNRVSTPVAPGAIQVAGGQPLILGVACGTMGGYPHVAHVISADLDRVGQLRLGDGLAFELVGLDEARRLDRELRAAQSADLLRIASAASDREERANLTGRD